MVEGARERGGGGDDWMVFTHCLLDFQVCVIGPAHESCSR